MDYVGELNTALSSLRKAAELAKADNNTMYRARGSYEKVNVADVIIDQHIAPLRSLIEFLESA